MLQQKIVSLLKQANFPAKTKSALQHTKKLNFTVRELTKSPAPLVDIVVVARGVCPARILGGIRNGIANDIQDRIHPHRLDEDRHAARLEDPADLALADIGIQMV
jgi:hypothetical protein